MMPTYGAIGSLIAQMKAKQMAGAGQPQVPEPQAGLLAAPQTPPDPPVGQGLLANAPTPEQMLAQQLSQNPVQGGPPVGAALMQDAPVDDAHAHRKGIRGGLLHLFGADRMAPEIAAELTEEQRSRVLPGLSSTLWNAVSRRVGPQQVQRERASDIIGDRDRAIARAKAQRDEAALAGIREEAMRLYPTDPQAQVEHVAQRSAAQLGGVTQAAQAAIGLRDRVPQRVTWTTVPMMVNGTQAMVMRSNDGQLLDAATGEDLREPGNTLAPMPPNPPTGSFGTEPSLIGPNGRPMVMNRQTGRMEEAPEGVARAGTQSAQEIKVIDNERSLAYNDAQLSMSGLMGADGKMKEPPSNFDRAATRSEWTNALASNEGQAYMNNVRKLIRSWVVLIEGKRMSDADARVNELQRSFAFGDGPDVIASKKATLESMAESIRALGTPRSANPASPAPASAPQSGRMVEINGKMFRIPE